MKNKHGQEMMPLWKFICRDPWADDGSKIVIIVQAWGRKNAIDILRDTPAVLRGIEEKDLKRMKAWANSRTEKIVLST